MNFQLRPTTTVEAEEPLEDLAEELEIPPYRYEQAEASYKSLGRWLQPGKFKHPTIRPAGPRSGLLRPWDGHSTHRRRRALRRRCRLRVLQTHERSVEPAGAKAAAGPRNQALSRQPDHDEARRGTSSVLDAGLCGRRAM